MDRVILKKVDRMIKCDLCNKNSGGYEIDGLILCLECYKHTINNRKNLEKFIKMVIY